MANKPWKKFERWVAGKFGTVRRPGSGAHGTKQGGQDDIKHPFLFVEAKHLQNLYTHTLFKEARIKARQDGGKIPILALHQKGTPYEECLICCRMEDLLPVAIMRGVTEDKEAQEQMAQNDQAPPRDQWIPTFSERFVSILMQVSERMQVDKELLAGGIKRYQQHKGSEEAQKMFDEMLSGDVEKMQKHIDGEWNRPTEEELDRKKKREEGLL